MFLKQVHSKYINLKCIKPYQSPGKQTLFHAKTRGRATCLFTQPTASPCELSGFILEANCSSLPMSQQTLKGREALKGLGNNESSTSLQIQMGLETNRNQLVKK